MKQDFIFACLAVQEEIPRRIEGFICQNQRQGFVEQFEQNLIKNILKKKI